MDFLASTKENEEAKIYEISQQQKIETVRNDQLLLYKINNENIKSTVQTGLYWKEILNY